MQVVGTRSGSLQGSTHWFALYSVACAALFFQPLHDLFRLSLSSEAYSHILVIPAVAAALLVMERAAIFRQAAAVPSPVGLPLCGCLLAGAGSGLAATLASSAEASLAFYILSFLIFLWAGFAWTFGWQTFRAALFPLAFLLLLIPPPAFLLDHVITWLQWGSADVTDSLFRLSMTPAVRQGLIFDLPGVTIEVAPECSGIRSSMALAITSLAAGYLFLRPGWARAAFWLAILPIAILKNGIRIVTLSLLAIHVDPGFLFGRLHRDGGFLFFGVGLVLLWCLLRGLQKIEQRRMQSANTTATT